MRTQPRLWRRRLRATTAAMATVCGIAAAASDPSTLPAAREAELRTLVLQDCGSCHGMTLRGGLGKPLVKQQLRDIAPESLAAIILDGIPGTPMPPWRGLLSETEAAWIAARLKEGLP